MKMAAAESLCHTELDPKFSILTVGTHNNCDGITRVIEVPYVLPFLAEGKFSGVTLQGAKDLQQQYQQKFGPGWYVPNLFVNLLVLPRDDRIDSDSVLVRAERPVAYPPGPGT
jgi:cytochrome d ubiquinol oxidase subunit I